MGRISRSIELTKQAHRVLMMDKELMLLPALSGAAVLVVCGTFVAGFWATGQDPAELTDAQAVIGGLLFYVVSYTIAFFFQAALVAAALERMGGGDPTVGSALRAARQRLGAIVVWGVIAGTVGMLLKAIQDRSELVGRIIAGLFGVAWSLATFFMVPVLVMEQNSIPDSFKRSAKLFRSTWGETLAGGFGIGLIGFLLMVPIVLLGMLIGSLLGPVVGIVLVVAALAIVGVFVQALQGVFTAALYRHATTGETPVGFDDRLIADAFRRSAR